MLVHPGYRVSTQDARRALPDGSIGLRPFIRARRSARSFTPLATGDLELLGRAMDDRLAEPTRKPLLPGFPEAKRAAMAAGALGCSISGAGPSVFAIVDDPSLGERVAAGMVDAYRQRNVQADWRVTRVDQQGVRLLPALDAPPVLRLV